MSLTPKKSGFELRLRYGKGKRDRFLLLTTDEALALSLEPRMEAMARKLIAVDPDVALRLLREAASVAGDAKKFYAVERVVDTVTTDALTQASEPVPAPGGYRTFRDVAEAWVSGKLTELYPDSKLLPPKEQKGRSDDRTAVSIFYPALGSKALADITHADLDEARRAIPRDLHPNTRRGYLVRLRSVFRIAAGPLRLITSVPEIDIPRRVPSNLFGYLYPQEEALLIGCTRVPLVYRVLYGYLARNGCRITETLRLTWDHVDLETGDIHIDKRWTKTRRARRWVLDSDVLEALEAWFIESKRPQGSARVFPGRQKARLSSATVRKRFIEDLKEAGVSRRSILEGADGIDPLRVHDLRASFVTLALRAGKPLKWIMTRTGHESLGVMKGYDRLVQDAEEHRLPAWFTHMARAIPEFTRHAKGGPRVGQSLKLPAEMASGALPGWTRELDTDEQKPAEKPTSVTTETSLPTTSGPAGNKGVGQPGPGQGEVVSSAQDAASSPTLAQTDPIAAALAEVEATLGRAIDRATAAGEWETVRILARELEARRLAREAAAAKAAGVASLEAARRKRDEREGGK